MSQISRKLTLLRSIYYTLRSGKDRVYLPCSTNLGFAILLLLLSSHKINYNIIMFVFDARKISIVAIIICTFYLCVCRCRVQLTKCGGH